MEKTISLLVILFFGISMAQNSHTFTTRLDYVFPGFDGTNEEMIFAKHYIPSQYSEKAKNSLIHFPMYISGQAGFSFVNDNQFITIENIDLENNFSMNHLDYYGYGNSVQILYDKVELKKIDRAPLTVLGKICNHFEVITTLEGEVQPTDFVLCIDEQNEIDNTTFLLPKQEGTQIKGLVLAVTSPEGNENERILLKSITPVNSTIQFDLKKELAAYQVKKDSIEKLYNTEYPVDSVAMATTEAVPYYYDDYMTQPKFCDYVEFYNLKFESDEAYNVTSSYMSNLCSYSYYLKRGDEEKYKSFVLKEIKGMKKNLPKSGLISKKDAQIFYEFLKKDIEAMKISKPLTEAEKKARDAEYAIEDAAIAAADAAAAAVEAIEIQGPDDVYDPYVSTYESSYKDLKPEDSNFAVTGLTEESAYWKGMPAYCKKMETVIPKFSDEELTKRARNYAGQICDMYLGEFEGSSVWYKGTLDAIRAEQMYFNNHRDKLSKKDKQLLDEFLNNLD